MAYTVLMPQLGISEDSAILTAWRVKQGDAVKAGDVLFSIETGKSTFDVESAHTGVVLLLLVREGEEVAVMAPVCAIGEEGEVYKTEARVENALNAGASDAEQALSGAVASTFSRKGAVSPRARKLAEKNGIDPVTATSTGPGGRVIERDIRALMDADARVTLSEDPPKPPAPRAAPQVAYEDRPLTPMRKAIAKNMTTSLQNTAQLTHTASFDATNVMDYREQLKRDPELSGISLTDIVLYAVTRALLTFPALNAHLIGDTMRLFSEVNLACAVDTEKGLMAPVIFNASGKSLLQISKELKTLAESCRDGSIPPNLLTGGSFTVSNLGQFGIESFTPILNPPQTGILGVNTITRRVREDGSVYPAMSLSLTYDHRALDGAPASRFLQALCKNLENFTALLAR